jgi:hypothetical protein
MVLTSIIYGIYAKLCIIDKGFCRIYAFLIIEGCGPTRSHPRRSRMGRHDYVPLRAHGEDAISTEASYGG